MLFTLRNGASLSSDSDRIRRGHEPCAIVLAVRIETGLAILDAHMAIYDLMSWSLCNLFLTRCANNRDH